MAERTIISKKASNIRKMFDAIAPEYDKLNRLISFGLDSTWRKSAVKLVSRTGARHVLDLAAGTGDFTIALSNAIPSARIVAADLSQNMLREADRKFVERGMSQVSTVQCNALHLPFKDNTFDAITCAFGVRNFSDLERGLGEMYRTLRPGGVAVILELCEPDRRISRGLYKLHAFGVIPVLGAVLGHNRKAYAYLPESIRRMPQRNGMKSIMEGIGFSRASFKVFPPGVCAMYVAYKPL
ncbi:hypothetical protein HQ35_01925 [Porphyromonas cangingivalis]|uniref:Demethylmenaquinone methyltransferase n=1 Tax=Porphyromonas cangingivalis TaxID=36874 RepID=A0A0A2F2X4_PORCN|nr:bifunctional demethylmenaquinone methyltransferase/2-methoxy-6-polyprenyl-1,4-benzoquinol methylase UbiE [Porphyromonas cangingivalis]KGN82834.1 hypothetical protein HQ35_01925 [Porphyromonas cangingivalis]